MTREEKADFYSELWGYDENSKKLAKMSFNDGFLEGEKSIAYKDKIVKELTEINSLLETQIKILEKQLADFKEKRESYFTQG